MVPMHCLIMPAAYAEGANENDVWHLDEVVVRINGQKSWVWRAVDQDGYVLDEIVQRAATLRSR
ncbi:DDE domain-containing protein [Mesorhizobium sp. M1A.F.Ca.IN.022.07.1.1]|uniref:DDE domain-containing protein n=1 Tax=Mesorhizobium muleiense TaxID=1004279 RepID=A0A1G9DI22_9HYPH|nr:DDE domain-containing protein [Mesorhizobium sp. M6A.T.Cr.TU.017.01.1.1]RUV98502.1 DDE domain-containing protein [Mesorhizobium sp. M1A.F.Ca.IN.022.07.1.1]RUW86415.1 DDE domain-containing protein [Mesorhizobium sp. M1E.F.Ca.ET.063.01.1.1]RVC45863.1 DDE domain-containing protein [Mesorhizobium sp. M4A.F.Ca.ET.090.04.2.1]RVD30051.1 DDE domain-containing protein [Mesorhizobium sp. M4B.F.Ca.ET.017.02.2.1]RWA66356.1 MAG: DDE domain-containing protein [Mesorhizobium sp.]TGQ09183.1 DDE domain-con